MDNSVLELSSDSNDTIILDTKNLSKDCDDFDVESIVKKYITENNLQTKENVEDNCRNCNFIDLVTVEEPKANTNLGRFTSSESASSLDSETDIYFNDIDNLKQILSPPSKKSKPEEKFTKSTSESASSQDTELNTISKELYNLKQLSEKYKHSSATDSCSESSSPDKNVKVTARNVKTLEKEIAKREKIQERERKRQEAQKQKAAKQALSAAYKYIKPEECMKFIQVIVDNAVNSAEYGSDVLNALQASDLKCEVKSQIIPRTISWIRKAQTHFVGYGSDLAVSSEDQETDDVLLIIDYEDFIKHVGNETLTSHIQSIQSILVNKKISLAIYGLQNYFRSQKQSKRDDNNEKNKDRRTSKLPKVSRRNVEYALTELQLLNSCSYRMVRNGTELGAMVVQFTKSIAQLPYKLQKNEKYEQTNWYFGGDNKDTVKVDKDGNGLQRLWKQVLTTFPLAGLEIAEAITERYLTPTSLMEAYEQCTTKEGELLLQDLPIRRAAGPLSSVRRIGPELSKKVYNFFTAIDGDSLL